MTTETWEWDQPNVCGSSPRSEILDESVCTHCKRPIYRTKWMYRWRHPDGFVLCVMLFRGRGHPDNTIATPPKT